MDCHFFHSRSWGIGAGQVGLKLGLASALGLLAGTIWSGTLADRLGYRDVRWYMRISGIGMLLTMPFGLLTLTTASTSLSFIYYCVTIGLLASWASPIHAMTQAIAEPRMRGIAAAIVELLFEPGSRLWTRTGFRGRAERPTAAPIWLSESVRYSPNRCCWQDVSLLRSCASPPIGRYAKILRPSASHATPEAASLHQAGPARTRATTHLHDCSNTTRTRIPMSDFEYIAIDDVRRESQASPCSSISTIAIT